MSALLGRLLACDKPGRKCHSKALRLLTPAAAGNDNLQGLNRAPEPTPNRTTLEIAGVYAMVHHARQSAEGTERESSQEPQIGRAHV